MNILFLGKPVTKSGKARLEELENQIIGNGHSISENNGSIKNIIAILCARLTNMNTIHVHSFMAAFWVTVLHLTLPQNIITIWTLDSIPELSSSVKKLIFKQYITIISSCFDKICVPTRTLQYRLLAEFGITSFYIPDGYTEPILYDIQPREYGLRNNQYGVILSQSFDAIQQIAQAYVTTKSKKKLVVFSQHPSPQFKKLIKEYPFITPISLPLTSRGAQSLVRCSGFIIMYDPNLSPLLLQAMDTNRVIIATTNPLHEEILGTTGFYFQKDDNTHLGELLLKATKDTLLPKYGPSIRAKHHFTWEKTVLEYEQLYTRKVAKLVPFDSLIAKQAVV